MRRALRSILVFAALVLAFACGSASDAAAADDASCSCLSGFGACQHYLRNPGAVTDDPCWCDLCATGAAGARHDGSSPPPGWNPDCWRANHLACYLKRHAAAWGIACSECFRLADCCTYPNHLNCPDCATGSLGPPVPKDAAGRDAKATVLARLAREAPAFRRPGDVIVAYDRNFYVVTDVDGLKVRTEQGGFRAISKHEWIHLMLERAEGCRRIWTRTLGALRTKDPRPIGIWLVEREADKRGIAAANFGTDVANSLIGTATRIADGFVVNGLAISEQRYPGDHGLLLQMRHEVTHNLLSLWSSLEVRPRSFPQWMYEGLGHWMTRLPPRTFEDDATYCAPEASGVIGAAGGRSGGPMSYSGRAWDLALEKMASDAGLEPIEALLAKTVKGDLTADEHKRSWSLVSLGLQELGKPFVDLLAALRREVDVREAFAKHLAMTPEDLDRRWRDRLLGRRPSLAGDPPAASLPPEAAAARERRAIRGEDDPATLAARIRQYGAVSDPRTVDEVIAAMARKHDLVRETALVTLLKTKDPACLERIRRTGLSYPDPVVRAYAARICGRLAMKEAVPRLVELLGDGNWYARAEAAVALGTLRHANSMAALRKMVASDPSEKAQLAAMDALAAFGEDARLAVPLILPHLESPRWQLQVAACQALARIGSMEAVGPLIERLDFVFGRQADEVRRALKAIVRDDLGTRPEDWRNWWRKEKARVEAENPGALPPRPPVTPSEGDPKRRADDERYGSGPKYYGIELAANSIAFVVDSSQSMSILFDPDPSQAKLLSRAYAPAEKYSICREEIVQALRRLDSWTHFSVVVFGTTARAFRERTVPATSGNVEEADGFLRSITPGGETNYYGGLKRVLDIGDEPDTRPSFRNTPDTLTFLTDGAPTRGDITDGDTLLEWFTGLNRYARVRTHTITFGRVGIDQPLLQALAARNGGTFLVVRERR